MAAKSQDVAIIAPICCAASMINSTRSALDGMCEKVPEMREGGPLHLGLRSMTRELEQTLEHLSAFRELYDRHLGGP